MSVPKNIKKMPDLSNVASNATAVGPVILGGTYYGLYLRFLTAGGAEVTTAQVKSEIVSIVLKINGETIYDLTPTFALDLQKFYGDSINAGNDNGIVPIFLERSNLTLEEEKALYAIGTALDENGQGVTSMTVEVKCGTLVNISRVELYGVVSNEQRSLGQHVRILKHPQTYGTTGIHEVSTLPREQVAAYLALHIEQASGTITDVGVTVGNNDIYQAVPKAVMTSLLKKRKKTPQSSYYHVSFDLSDDLASILPMAGVTDFRQRVNWSVSPGGSYNVYSERVFGLTRRAA